MTDVRGTSGDDFFDNRLLKLGPGDNIYGEAGNDRFISTTLTNFVGGPGDDILEGGGIAMAVYWEAAGPVTVDLDAGYALDGHAGRDTLIGINGAHGSGFDDRFFGNAGNNTFWPNGGQDYVDGRGGEDLVNLTLDPAQTTWTKLGAGHWKYSNPMGSGELVNVELLQYLHNGKFSGIFTLSGDAPRMVTAGERQQLGASVAQIATDYYTLTQFGFDDQSIQEAHPAFNYPKITDTQPAGSFGLDPHNMVTGDFNGDGLEDLLVSWVAFPHTVFRDAPIYPAIYLNNGDGTLGPANIIFKGPLPDRHMNYRSLVADFNGDGIDDILISSMAQPLPNDQSKSLSEPISLILSDGAGKMFDASANIAGQENGGVPQGYSFGHDLSVGDVDGDGDIDFYTNKVLMLNDGEGQFSLGTMRMPQDARDNSTYVMSSGMGDLDGDGIDDLVVAYAEGFGRYAFLSQGNGIESARVIRLPEGPYGLANAKSNYLVVGDLTGDGLADILIACTRADPYYEGQYLQLFVNKGNGVFEEEASRIDNTPFDKHHGEGQIYLRDMNGDGSADIVHSTGMTYSQTDGIVAGGTDIFLNDGQGFFKPIDPAVLAYVRTNQLDGWGYTSWGQSSLPPRMVPIGMAGGPGVDLVGSVATPNYGPHPNISQVTLYLTRNTKPLGRGFDETLIGSANADLIWGLDGNDSIDGRLGIDTAAFSDKFADVTWRFDGKSLIITTETEGTDRLNNIEILKFADKTIDVAELVNRAPSFTAALQTVSTTAGAAKTITLLATDVDGDVLTYTVSTPGKGTASISGSTLTYTPGVTAWGSDSFVVTASDGKGGSATQTIDATVIAALAPRAFTINTLPGWAGSIGGNGSVTGSNGFEDITVLFGQISLDGSFNRGGDIIRVPGSADSYLIGRTSASNAYIEADTATRVAIPISSAGLGIVFEDGVRKLSFSSGAYKIGNQTFTAAPTKISSASDDTVLQSAANPAAQAVVNMLAAGLSGATAVDLTIAGKARIAGSNGVDVIKVGSAGGDLTFDGSFNRGGDIIILNKTAGDYSAAKLNASTIVITSDIERLAIPMGSTGMTLRFIDGDRALIFKSGAFHIGEQPITSTTATPLTPSAITLSADQGVAGSSVALDATGATIITDDARKTSNVILTNFSSDDVIRVTGAAAEQYNFAISDADPKDLEITYTDPITSATNTIVLDNVIINDAFIENYQTAATALGWNFMTFG